MRITGSAIYILIGVLVLGCDSDVSSNDDPFVGVYEVAEFTAPDHTDGQRDILQYGVHLELTLTRDRAITDGLYVEPCYSAQECSSIEERTTVFEGKYSVNGDTLVLRFNHRIGGLPQEGDWHFDLGKLYYRMTGWPPRPEVTLVRGS